MLNFREELAKKRQRVTYQNNEPKQCEEHVENILKLILQYYENSVSVSSTEAKEINFHINDKNNIIVKIIDLDDEDGTYDYSISYNLKSRKEAKNVLSLLNYKFRTEAYRIMYGKSVEKDEEFSVLID